MSNGNKNYFFCLLFLLVVLVGFAFYGVYHLMRQYGVAGEFGSSILFALSFGLVITATVVLGMNIWGGYKGYLDD